MLDATGKLPSTSRHGVDGMTMSVISHVLCLVDSCVLTHRSAHQLEVLFVIVYQMDLPRETDDCNATDNHVEYLLAMFLQQ